MEETMAFPECQFILNTFITTFSAKNFKCLHIPPCIRTIFFQLAIKDPQNLTQLYSFFSIYPVFCNLVTPSSAHTVGGGSGLEADKTPSFSNSAGH